MRWAAAGDLGTDSLITHLLAPKDLPNVYRMIEEGNGDFLEIVFN